MIAGLIDKNNNVKIVKFNCRNCGVAVEIHSEVLWEDLCRTKSGTILLDWYDEGLPVFTGKASPAIWKRNDYAINAKRIEDQQSRLF